MVNNTIKPDLTERLLDLTNLATDLVVRMHSVQRMHYKAFLPHGKSLEDVLANELCAVCIEANALMMQAESVASGLAGKTLKELLTEVVGTGKIDDEKDIPKYMYNNDPETWDEVQAKRFIWDTLPQEICDKVLDTSREAFLDKLLKGMKDKIAGMTREEILKDIENGTARDQATQGTV